MSRGHSTLGDTLPSDTGPVPPPLCTHVTFIFCTWMLENGNDKNACTIRTEQILSRLVWPSISHIMVRSGSHAGLT